MSDNNEIVNENGSTWDEAKKAGAKKAAENIVNRVGNALWDTAKEKYNVLSVKNNAIFNRYLKNGEEAYNKKRTLATGRILTVSN